MSKNEQHFNTLLNQYLRDKKFHCYYELKDSGGQNSFLFSKIRKVQWDGLQAMERNGLVWKLSDEISRPKPCDGFSLPPLPAYLIIIFAGEFVFIRFNKIVDLRNEGVISVSRSKAESIADKIIKT
jgi:hypothetical protein